MLAFAIVLALVGLTVSAHVFAAAPSSLRVALAVYNGFYLLTSVAGAVLVTHPDFQLVWMLVFPGMDVTWLTPGGSIRYWVLVLGPLIVVNLVALRCYAPFRGAAMAAARNLDTQVSMISVALVGVTMVAYCLTNLATHGYLDAGLLGAGNAGIYRENIQLRAEMARVLGDMHYGFIYMGIPAVCITAFIRALQLRRASWWLLTACLFAALCVLYVTTLTKGNIIVFFVALGVAAYLMGAIRIRGIVMAGLSSLVVLTALDALLAGSGLLEFAATVSNIVLRLSSAIPFYVDVFPAQEPFVGIDLGLQWFGIGPDLPANLVVFNYMYPKITWVQGAAPAAAHISAYAQGGMAWSLLIMALIGAVIGFFGALGNVARSAIARSAFVGGVIACYYTTQVDFAGVFNHSYGYKWWAAGLLAIAAVEHGLRWFTRPAHHAAATA